MDITKMDVTKIPYNKYVGIKKSTVGDFILEIEDLPQYFNHLGTVHAAVEFALAEATSGQFMIDNLTTVLSNKALSNRVIVPVVKNVQLDYKKPAKGKLFSKANMSGVNKEKVQSDLESKGYAQIKVNVQIFDADSEEVFISTFTWYIKAICK